MKKNYLKMFLYLFIVVFGINVYAEDCSYYVVDDSNVNYSLKQDVRELKSGDIITIKAIAICGLQSEQDSYGYSLLDGKFKLVFDGDVFETVKNNDHSYVFNTNDFPGMTIVSENQPYDYRKYNVEFKFNNDLMINEKNHEILSVKFKVKNDAKSGNTSISVYEDSGYLNVNGFKINEESEPYTFKVDIYTTNLSYNINSLDNNTKLSSLSINSGNLDPSFDPNTYGYITSTNNSEVIINAVCAGKNCKVNGNGTKKLEYGINTLPIEVISEAGEKSVYTIKVTRNDLRSEVNTLKTLTLSSGKIDFNSEILEYDIYVANNINSITITSSLMDKKSQYVSGYGDRVEYLNEGLNKIYIKVLSEKGEERVYTLNIVRSLSSDNTLRSLSVSGKNIDIVNNVFDYKCDVVFDNLKPNIKAIPNNDNAEVVIDSFDELLVGENVINIKVIAPNGQEVYYYLTINRLSQYSDNALLKQLRIGNHPITFDSNIKDYEIVIKNETELEIFAKSSDDKAKVTITGNENLRDGSIIIISVVAEDLITIDNYYLHIKENRDNSLFLIILIIMLTLIIIGVITIWIILYKKNHPKEEKVKEETEVNKETKVNKEIEVNKETEVKKEIE